MTQDTQTTTTAAEARVALEALADAGHLAREFKSFDDLGREVEHIAGVWCVPETGDRAASPIRRHVVYVSEWLPA